MRLEASRHDRNLRFMLGHGFTLEKLSLRIMEIEEDEGLLEQASVTSQRPPMNFGRRVSFSNDPTKPSGEPRGQRKLGGRRAVSPPPTPVLRVEEEAGTDGEDEDEDEDQDINDYENDDTFGVGLVRFDSASMMPPRKLPDSQAGKPVALPGDSTPPSTGYPQSLLKETIGGEGDEVLIKLYQSIRGCSCQKQGHDEAPLVHSIWRLPNHEKTAHLSIPRMAIAAV